MDLPIYYVSFDRISMFPM